MLAKIKQIQIKPATFDDEGVKTEPYASLNLNVPLDNMEARKEILALFEVLRTEYVNLSVEKDQLTFDVEE